MKIGNYNIRVSSILFYNIQKNYSSEEINVHIKFIKSKHTICINITPEEIEELALQFEITEQKLQEPKKFNQFQSKLY